MPNLNRLARKGLLWSHAYSTSTHSDYSDVCIVSSLFPLRTRYHHYYSRTDPWPKTLIYDLLRPLGYATAIISSQNEGWGAMDKFLESSGLDLLLDSERSRASTHISDRDIGLALEIRTGALRAGKLDDSVTTDLAIGWVSEQIRRGKPFFLSMNFQNAHFPYELFPDTERPFQPGTIDFPASFLSYPLEKTEIVRNAYFNAQFETDLQIGRFLEALEKHKILDNVILVVYGENGEAFHEKGLVTHAQDPIESAVRVACVFYGPRFFRPGIEEYPFSLIDIVPTVLGQAGFSVHPNFQGIDCLSLLRPPTGKRLLFIHNENALTRTDSVILGGRWKYVQNRKTREEFLYDLHEDPSERASVLNWNSRIADKLRNVYDTWRCRQLSYYENPAYFQRYYPPLPPVLE
jgi:arylsulfatase A-like enzyme